MTAHQARAETAVDAAPLRKRPRLGPDTGQMARSTLPDRLMRSSCLFRILPHALTARALGKTFKTRFYPFVQLQSYIL